MSDLRADMVDFFKGDNEIYLWLLVIVVFLLLLALHRYVNHTLVGLFYIILFSAAYLVDLYY